MITIHTYIHTSCNIAWQPSLTGYDRIPPQVVFSQDVAIGPSAKCKCTAYGKHKFSHHTWCCSLSFQCCKNENNHKTWFVQSMKSKQLWGVHASVYLPLFCMVCFHVQLPGTHFFQELQMTILAGICRQCFQDQNQINQQGLVFFHLHGCMAIYTVHHGHVASLCLTLPSSLFQALTQRWS